jgi:hypothetical protein
VHTEGLAMGEEAAASAVSQSRKAIDELVA